MRRWQCGARDCDLAKKEGTQRGSTTMTIGRDFRERRDYAAASRTGRNERLLLLIMLYLLPSYPNDYLVSDLWQLVSIVRHESYFRRSELAQLRNFVCMPWQSTINGVISPTVFI